mgnify:FL=1
MIEPTDLQLFWAVVLGLSLLLYAVLDGFDLGVGILFGMTHEESSRRIMIRAVEPVWDGNETWLLVAGAGLYAAFPTVYAIFFSALYLPVVLLLIALIFRGVAFEFRNRATRHRGLWDQGFFLGSLAAAFVQGAAVGVLVEGIPVENGQFAGNAFSWLSPFSVLCGTGLVLAYTLHGAAWLVVKTGGNLRDRIYVRMPWLLAAAAVVFILVIAYAWMGQMEITRRWQDIGGFWWFPVLLLAALAGFLLSLRKRRDHLLFLMSALVFITAFTSLLVSLYPYMIPFSVTISQGAASASALSFLFWGAGVIMLPVILLYTVIVYWVFRGRIETDEVQKY